MQSIRCFAYAASVDGDRLNDLALLLLQPHKKFVDVTMRQTFAVILNAENVHHVLDRHYCVPATPSQRVDQLVANDGRYPRADWPRLVPSVALKMNREKHFLHDL